MKATEHLLVQQERALRADGVAPLRGGDFEPWDIEATGGLLGSCRVQMAVEEHGSGRQLVRFRSWPHHASWVLVLLVLVAAGAADAAIREARTACHLLAVPAVLVGFPGVRHGGA